MSDAIEYVLGTHDEEIARLRLQHDVWRQRAMAAWRDAGFSAGHCIVDLGSGPGFATLDLARTVGPGGRVTAIDLSRRFLDHLERAAAAEHLSNIRAIEQDLNEVEFDGEFDGAWARWAFAFVQDPRSLLARVAESLATGGTMAIHEYCDYATWRLLPPCGELDEFVAAVLRSWRASGGEPDIALSLPRWLEGFGFQVTFVEPFVDVVTPEDPRWAWLAAFVETGRNRLVDLGVLAPDRAAAIGAAAAGWPSQTPRIRMMTPAVLQIIATKR